MDPKNNVTPSDPADKQDVTPSTTVSPDTTPDTTPDLGQAPVTGAETSGITDPTPTTSTAPVDPTGLSDTSPTDPVAPPPPAGLGADEPPTPATPPSIASEAPTTPPTESGLPSTDQDFTGLGGVDANTPQTMPADQQNPADLVPPTAPVPTPGNDKKTIVILAVVAVVLLAAIAVLYFVV